MRASLDSVLLPSAMSDAQLIGALLGAAIIAVVIWNILHGGVAEDNGEITEPPPDAP